MKPVINSLLAVGLFCLTFTGTLFGVTPPPGVAVTYALVPKERLADAVKGKREALEIEDAWRRKMMSESGPPPYPMNLGMQRYSIVVFVEIPARFALWGRIGIPVQNPRNPVILNVTLAPGYSGTYVIEGALVLTKGILPEPKPYEWLEVHIE